MKKTTLTILIALSLLLSGNSDAQGKSRNSFIEWNFGIAYIGPVVLPGTSVLWGRTHINDNNFIFEYEAGFALPSIVTGKLGIGKKFNNTKVIVGVRPFPFNLYLQSSFMGGRKGYPIVSIEYNPLVNSPSLYRAIPLSFYSTAILNFGYRWRLGRR
jgi:hypothetical protein